MPHPSVPICILASQYFGWGIYGGFGSMSRMLAESLAASGLDVEVIVPRRKGQEPLEVINGVRVRSFPVSRPHEAYRLIRSSQAKIFHSQDPTVLTAAARAIHAGRAHLVTCRDPRDLHDWWTEFLYATPTRRLLTPLNYLSESGPVIAAAVRRADRVYVPAHFLRTKVQRMFRLPDPAGFMPNLIEVPESVPPPRRTSGICVRGAVGPAEAAGSVPRTRCGVSGLQVRCGRAGERICGECP
jgi:hypothetical protein